MNIAAKTNRPHSAVPQNFQIRGGLWGGVTVTEGFSGVRESIRGLSIGANSISTSCPVLYRASTFFLPQGVKNVDGRDKPGHDEIKSGQRPLQQTTDIAAGQIDRAVHAGVIPGKPCRGEQFGMMRR